MTAHKLDAERRAFGNSVPHTRVEQDPLYLLIRECVRKRGLETFVDRWPEWDAAIRDAVEQWRQREGNA